MAGVSGCESCRGKAGLNALKNIWHGACGCESCRGKASLNLNALKNRWLGRVAARVALARHAGGFGACSCESGRGKASGRVWSV